MKVAILGASSFIGMHVAKSIRSSGAQVSSFVREKVVDSVGDLGDQIEFDFHNLSSFSTLIPEFDVVIHLVSSSNPASSGFDPEGDIENNLIGSIRLLRILRANPSVKLIFASSGGAVYGNPVSVPILETHPTDPVSPYGVSKLAIEKHLYISRLEHGLDYRILRLSNPFGPGQVNKKGQGLIPTVIDKAISGESLTVWGNGSNTRDYVYIEDVVDAFMKAIEYSGKIRTFNIGSGIGSSTLDIVSEVSELTNKEIKVDFSPSRATDPPSNVLDVGLAKSELNWEAKTSLRDGIQSSISWYLKRLEE
jgi:UDP-glucose 4-epimerase